MYTKFWSQNIKGRDHLEDVSIDGRKIFKQILEKQGMSWINLTQDRVQW
jgi:hypothetical protein